MQHFAYEDGIAFTVASEHAKYSALQHVTAWEASR